MTAAAPAAAAAWTTLSPTPPAPITTTRSPAATRALCSTAPTPVMTAQAMTDAVVNPTPSGTATTCEAWTTTSSANAPQRMPCRARRPSARRIGLVSSSRKVAVHRVGSPAAAAGARPAVAHEADDDPVAGPHAVDAGADLLDDPRGLVPEHDRHVAAPRPVEGRDVAVADGAGARRRTRTSSRCGGSSTTSSMESGSP